MKDFFKRVKADAIMSAVLCIALGVVLIVWPGETINIVCKVLAAGLIILGGIELFSYITNRNGYMFTGILGLIVLIVGVWIFLKPSSIVSLVPIVIGVILAVHGVQDVKMALESKDYADHCHYQYCIWRALHCQCVWHGQTCHAVCRSSPYL